MKGHRSIITYDIDGRPIYHGDVCYQVYDDNSVRVEEPLVALRLSLLAVKARYKFRCVRVKTNFGDRVAPSPKTLRVYNGCESFLYPSQYSFQQLINKLKAPTR